MEVIAPGRVVATGWSTGRIDFPQRRAEAPEVYPSRCVSPLKPTIDEHSHGLVPPQRCNYASWHVTATQKLVQLRRETKHPPVKEKIDRHPSGARPPAHTSARESLRESRRGSFNEADEMLQTAAITLLKLPGIVELLRCSVRARLLGRILTPAQPPNFTLALYQSC